MELKSFKSSLLRFSFLLFFSLGTCQKNDDPWISITLSDTYKNQPNCSQTCLLNVVNQIPNCVDFACVCTGDVLGSNFVAGFNDVSACAQQTCGNSVDAKNAAIAFRNICLIQEGFISASTTSTSTSTPTIIPVTSITASPIETILGNSTIIGSSTVTVIVTTGTGTGTATTGTVASLTSQTALPSQTVTYLLLINTTSYSSLTSCSKFCLNSCRDPTGNITEPQCSTDKKPPGYDSYFGLAYELQCQTPSCLCAGGAFNLTYSTLWKKSLLYCNYLPTLQDRPDPEYDRLQGVLADYCALNHFSPGSWMQTVVGSGNNSALTPPVLSNPDKIAIGVGVPSALIAIAAAIATGVQAWVAYRRYRDAAVRAGGRRP
ncbi:uncharacterized protein PAC_12113 [Phialocephala subalpina]|uniref:Extracellular membrane protein CFEM domain-containing protein n=1 Tax=Phialocephala subalpina TaxID=576137 RepID=A0A1L7XB41_9HELO|nr:uncharacterized protein PAC_12113 [Phialocephala subalpina]